MSKEAQLSLNISPSEDDLELEEEDFIDWMEKSDEVESYQRIKSRDLFVIKFSSGEELAIRQGDIELSANLELEKIHSFAEDLDLVIKEYLSFLNTSKKRVEYSGSIGLNRVFDVENPSEMISDFTQSKDFVAQYRRIGFDFERDEKYYAVQLTDGDDTISLNVSAFIDVGLVRLEEEEEEEEEEQTLGDVLNHIEEIFSDVAAEIGLND